MKHLQYANVSEFKILITQFRFKEAIHMTEKTVAVPMQSINF